MRETINCNRVVHRVAGEAEYPVDGAFTVVGPCGETLNIWSSDGVVPEALGWEHVSVSTNRRCPNWQEMCFVKDMFWLPEECVIQYHVPVMHHINNHPFCLHLWRNKEQSIPMPPPEMVGIRNLEPEVAKRVMYRENKRMRLEGRGVSMIGIAASLALSGGLIKKE